jgi:malonyl-CoA O-methyltransferase
MSVQQIVKGFARAAGRYDAHAQVQYQCAGRLAAYIEANSRDLTPGAVLEVGCGTGIVSKRLPEIFAGRRLVISDVCPEMLNLCRQRLEQGRGVARDELEFAVIDADHVATEKKYAAAVAAFTLQWMQQLEHTLQQLTAALLPQGRLFFSVPTAGSFPEWKQVCRAAGVTCTVNDLPDARQFRSFAQTAGMRLSLYEENFPVHHPSFAEFLLSLKSIGAGTQTSHARLSVGEMRKLLAAAEGKPFTATYKVLFGHVSQP